MEFQPKTAKNAVKVTLKEGALIYFTGKEIIVGYGDKKPLNQRKFIVLMRKIVATAKANKAKDLGIDYKDIKSLAPQHLSDYDVGRIAGCAFEMANYEFNKRKTPPKEGFPSVEIMGIENTPEKAKAGFWDGRLIALSVNECRTLSNTPGLDMTPKKLAAAAKNAVKGTKATVKVLGKKEMEKLGMGAVLGIAQGSQEEPQFIILEYKGGSSTRSGRSKPVVLIGKGVTFDSGGLNIKPGDSMLEMHMDMSGGAAVISAVALAAKLKLKANVIGLVPAVENMPSGSALRPGDIVKSLSGKTIEVLNTDAEGRVILSDAITYAKRYDPAVVVEASTLTGAALVALGLYASGLMTSDEKLQAELIELGEKSGDYLWPFPQWEEYEESVKGNFADVANIPANGNTRYGGVINGGMFLREFAKELNCSFAHLDIAPRMTAAAGEHLAKGAIGTPVRLFLALIERHARN